MISFQSCHLSTLLGAMADPALMSAEMKEVLAQLESLKVNQQKERVHARKAKIKADVATFKQPSEKRAVRYLTVSLIRDTNSTHF